MTIQLISIKEFLEIYKTFKTLGIQFNSNCDNISYVINGDLYFDKQKVFNGFYSVKQIKALTRDQVEKAAGFKDKSFNPDYEIDGEEFFEIPRVRNYLSSKNSGCDICEIEQRIQEALNKTPAKTTRKDDL